MRPDFFSERQHDARQTPRASRLRRPAPRRLRRRSAPPATGRAVSFVSSGQRPPAPFGDATDVGFAVADSFLDSGRVASRPGFPLQSPLRSDFRCNPSRLRSLRSLRGPLARRFAPLTSAFLATTVAQRAGIRVLPSPRSALALPRLPWPAAPAPGCASARRRPHSRTPPCSRRAAARPLTSPRRLPSGSDSGTGLPYVPYSGLGPSYALRRLGSHTPRSGLPGPSRPAPAPTGPTVQHARAATNRHEHLGSSEWRSNGADMRSRTLDLSFCFTKPFLAYAIRGAFSCPISAYALPVLHCRHLDMRLKLPSPVQPHSFYGFDR